jgi:hypothetical protein
MDLEEMQEALSTNIARVGEKLRVGKLLASRISILVETNSFQPELPQYHASVQTMRHWSLNPRHGHSSFDGGLSA